MTHVADGALVRWLDDECEAEERHEVAAHLDHCGECRARLSATRRRASLVRAALQDADRHAVPRSRRAPWVARAAAVIVLFAVAAATVSPVRAWIVERVTGWWVAVTHPASSSPPHSAPQVAPTAPPQRVSVTFAPAGEVFIVEVANRQVTGRLVIERSDGDDATASVEGGDGSEQLVVLPAGLRIVNPPTGVASFRVHLPARVRSVHVVIAEAQPLRLALPARGAAQTLPLHSDPRGASETGAENR